MEQFETPIVLMIFKRKEKIKLIMDVVRKKQPKKLYILGDGARNEEERIAVEECRKAVEEAVTWPCEVVKHYSDENIGVYGNIGLGAKWVFQHEEQAIFLEDDNLPELSFFDYCESMLNRYQKEEKVLWICGTNYLEDYVPQDGSDYVFTQHLLPCGWASWSNKFLKYYDGDLELTQNPEIMSQLAGKYKDQKLYKQQLELTLSERNRIEQGGRPNSWDYQMEFSLRANNLFGISPRYNQIRNIGVDEDSIHGGSSMTNIMTERFCNIESYPLEFPLNHPLQIEVDEDYEYQVGKIILQPLSIRLKKKIAIAVRQIFNVPDNVSTLSGIKNFFGRGRS